MAIVTYKRDARKETLIELIDRFSFRYFLSMDPNLYLLGNYDEFNYDNLQAEIYHNYQLEEVYALKWVRLFSPKIQLEWKKREDRYQIVLISEEEIEVDGFKVEKLKVKSTKKKVYLWGELDYDQYRQGNPIWYEGQVPRLLDYPLDAAEIGRAKEDIPKRAYLNLREYQFSANGKDILLEHYLNFGAEDLVERRFRENG